MRIKSKIKRDWLGGYKTYDTTNGFGSPEEWQSAFKQRLNIIIDIFTNDDSKDILMQIKQCRTIQELKSTFRKLILQFHPDTAGATEYNLRISQKLIEVYNKQLEML